MKVFSVILTILLALRNIECQSSIKCPQACPLFISSPPLCYVNTRTYEIVTFGNECVANQTLCKASVRKFYEFRCLTILILSFIFSALRICENTLPTLLSVVWLVNSTRECFWKSSMIQRNKIIRINLQMFLMSHKCKYSNRWKFVAWKFEMIDNFLDGSVVE